MISFLAGGAFLACCLAAAVNAQMDRGRWAWWCFLGAVLSVMTGISV